MKKFQTENLSLYRADCLDLMATMADNSVDLIATDPPYFKVKTDAWDNQWQGESDFFAWLDTVLAEMARILKPTGSIYLFAGPHLATRVEMAVREHFSMLNHLIWRKPTGRHNGCQKEALRRYFPQTEHIMFAESNKPVPFAFDPILQHLRGALDEAGVSRKAVDEATGCKMSGHWFGRSQWSMPGEKHYGTLQQLLGGRLKPYQELYAEYRSLLDGFNAGRRVFQVSKAVPYTNVWDFKPVQYYPGKHPCEKPLDLMRHIIEASSLPGQVVFDAFTGSGSTMLACIDTGRQFIGAELGELEFEQAVGRVRA